MVRRRVRKFTFVKTQLRLVKMIKNKLDNLSENPSRVDISFDKF